METTFIETEDFECKIRLKKDLYNLFKYNSKCQVLKNNTCIF